MKFLLFTAAAASFLLASCSATRTQTAAGDKFLTVSVGENATDKWWDYDPETGRLSGRTIGQNQTEGIKVVGGAINTGIGIDRAAAIWQSRIGRDQAIATATLDADTQVKTLTETNRHVEAVNAAENAFQLESGTP